MTTLLAIETSADSCSVALAVSANVIHRHTPEARQHAQSVLPLVDEVLAAAGIGLPQVDGLVFSRGPGSFTGVRIGFSVAQGLAYGADLPVLPVSTLQALAAAAQTAGFTHVGERVCSAFDARMNEVYVANYEITPGLPKLLDREQVLPVTHSEQWLPQDTGVAVGSAFAIEQLAAKAGPRCFPTLQISAADLLSVAQPLWRAGEQQAIDDVQPVYLRDEVSWNKRTRIRNLN